MASKDHINPKQAAAGHQTAISHKNVGRQRNRYHGVSSTLVWNIGVSHTGYYCANNANTRTRTQQPSPVLPSTLLRV